MDSEVLDREREREVRFKGIYSRFKGIYIWVSVYGLRIA